VFCFSPASGNDWVRTSLSLPGDTTGTVADVRQALRAHGAEWASLLDAESSLAAVNQTMAREHTPVSDGDEVAFSRR